MNTVHRICFRCGISSGTKSVPSHWHRVIEDRRVILCSRCRHSPDPAIGWREWEAQVLVEGRDATKAARLEQERVAKESAHALQEASDQWHRNMVRSLFAGRKVF